MRIEDDLLHMLGRQTYYSVDLDIVESNFLDMRKIVGDKVRIAVVLKADAYGQRAPVIGLVCMDQTMIDVGNIEGAAEGDEVILLGGGTISLAEAAEWASTNRNELLCGIGRRVPRLYIKRGRPVAFDDRLSFSTLKWL